MIFDGNTKGSTLYNQWRLGIEEMRISYIWYITYIQLMSDTNGTFSFQQIVERIMLKFIIFERDEVQKLRSKRYINNIYKFFTLFNLFPVSP